MNKSFKQFLKKLGLETEEATTLQVLFGRRSLSVSEISRLSKVNRTSTYRILNKLEQDGFVKKNNKSKTTKYSASSLEWIKLKVLEKKQKADNLGNLFSRIEPQLKELINKPKQKMNVVHYSGEKEARQLLWNSLKAKQILRVFGYRSSREAIGLKFLISWWNEMVCKEFEYRIIANPETFKTKYDSDALSKGKFKKPNYWKPRYIPKSVLPINHEVLIYNDVFAILQWEDSNIFGAEIINRVVADQQKLFFDFFWSKSEKFELSIDQK